MPKLAALLIVLAFMALLLAVNGEEEIREIRASEVREKILSGEPAEFDDYTIRGDLNLSEMTITGPVHFNDTIFQNSTNFNHTTFISDAYFGSAAFSGYADFNYSVFNGYADFRYSVFNGYASFRYSVFNGYANFRYSVFNGYANFVSSDFNGYADFRNSKFNGTAKFESSYFKGTAKFEFSKFNGANFMSSAFNGSADFRSSAFNGYAIFQGSVVKGYAYFSNSDFNDIANFNSDTFDKDAFFNDDVFNGYTSFDNSQFKGDAFFKDTTFNRRLSLTDTTYYKLFIRWHKITILVYDAAAYMSLMKNFKDLGYFEDYDSCYYQYRKEHRGQPWPGIDPFEESVRKFFDVFLEIFYGYGKKPLLPLAWSLGTILSFGVVWSAIEQRRPKVVLDEYDPTQNINKKTKFISVIKPFLFSAATFLSGTKLFVDPPEVPNEKSSLIKVAFIFERVLGALFSILFFLAISGTVVR